MYAIIIRLQAPITALFILDGPSPQEAVKQRESEVAVLGRQLQLQTVELEDARKNCKTSEEVQQLLEQANMDIVRMSSQVFVSNRIQILVSLVLACTNLFVPSCMGR